MGYRSRRRDLSCLVGIAALGVIALAATAQAATSDFFVEGSSANLHATFSGEQLSVGSLAVPALNIEVNCNKFKVMEGLLENNSKARGKFLFEECLVRELGGALEPITLCHIIASASDSKLHITATGVILPAELSTGTPAVLVEGISALILFKSGMGCFLPADILVTGELCLELQSNHTEKLKLLAFSHVQEFCNPRVLNALGDPAGTKVKDVLKYGAQTATISASVGMFLTGTHSGDSLGILLL